MTYYIQEISELGASRQIVGTAAIFEVPGNHSLFSYS